MLESDVDAEVSVPNTEMSVGIGYVEVSAER